jgi:hypothetical protein
MKNKILVEIADCVFLVIFNAIKTDFDIIHKKKFQQYFFSVYRPFFLRKKKVENYITINLISSTQFNFINKKNRVYILFYHKIGNQIFIPYYIGFTQFNFIMRLLISKLIKNKGFFIHSSSAVINNQACVFLGKSGSGKSTIIKLIKNFAKPINDDLSLIKRDGDNRFYLVSTPFPEKELWFQRINSKYPIKAFFFLKKAQFNRIKKIESEEILSLLLPQIWLYKKGKSNLKPVLSFLKDIYHCSYYFYFNKNESQITNCLKNFFQNTPPTSI